MANVIPVYIYTDRMLFAKALKENGKEDDEIQKRLLLFEKAYQDYLMHPQIYRETLLNNSSTGDYRRIINAMLEKHQNYSVLQQRLVFVCMSFNPRLNDYFTAMKNAVQAVNPTFKCDRAERELIGNVDPILAAVLKNIQAATLVIVDLTENRPNVLYELGRVQEAKKQCIITAQEGTELVLYSSQFPVIFYKNAEDLKEQLVKSLKDSLPKIEE